MKHAAFYVLAMGVLFCLCLFLVLPVVAIFVDTSPVALLTSLTNPISGQALLVSLQTTVAALALILVVATPASYMLGRRDFRGKQVLVTAVELPLVLPPAVAGIGLLAAFGPRGLFGGYLAGLGISLSLSKPAVVIALVFVAAPIYLRQAQASFAAIDGSLFEASQTLGASPAKTFVRVALPLARSGLSAGAALAWARALGEFGATLMFAGSFEGVSQTLPLAIYASFGEDFTAALGMSAVLVAVSAAVLMGSKLLGGGFHGFRLPFMS
jgi:molybdate transport system permease protein